MKVTPATAGLSEPTLLRQGGDVPDLLPSETRRAEVETPSLRSDFAELVKLRLSMLVVFTTLLGFYLGWEGAMDYALMFHTVLGTALCAGGAGALNQYLEREFDARMRRTRTRPLPAGRISPDVALAAGVGLCVVGMIELVVCANLAAAALAAATIVTYLLVYTPLKRRTTLNTLVGAVPGAIPPLIGWAAATGRVNFGGWLLFALMFAWQMPHFLAIAWMYRDDYAQAGFVMLPSRDPEGISTGRQSVNYALITLLLGMAPALVGLTTVWHFPVALLLGAAFSLAALRFHVDPTHARAKSLFLASIIYLPLLLGSLALFKRH